MSENKIILSSRREEQYQRNAEIVKFLRRNPIIACEELLGVPLIDSQKWILQESWNTPNVMWTCSRNFGKSFMIAVMAMLKLLLYPNIKIYILSSKGSQAQETFLKIEQIAKQQIESIDGLKDIFINEIEKPKNSDGFVHDKASFRVSVFGGGTTFTLNSIPDNVRGKRANLLFFDESSFCSDELIEVALPFIAQDASFKLSTNEEFNLDALYTPVPNQVVYASSAGDITSRHAVLYRDYAKKMVIGDRDYFSADIPCDIPLAPLYNGKPMSPLLSQRKIDDDMRANPDKAMREYYNKFQTDGGNDQIIKWATIRRNESFRLPQLASQGIEKFVIAFDPAHSDGDNSIVSVMKILYDKDKGYYGEIRNCTNLLDLKKKKKMNMKSTDQLTVLRNYMVDYSSGAKLYYEGIEAVLIDAGSGGHGTSYADKLLEDWYDEKGVKRAGIIDKSHEKYKDESRTYPDAKDILRLVSPQKYKVQMINEFISLMMSDLIKFPQEYDGKPEMAMELSHTDTMSDITYKPLSVEEQIALVNIDIMKSETTSIHRYGSNFAIAKDKASRINDDRFDTLVLLAHYLYELRRDDQFGKKKKKRSLHEYLQHN